MPDYGTLHNLSDRGLPPACGGIEGGRIASLAEVATLDEVLELSHKETTGLDVKSNMHVHLPPNYSAFDSVEQALELAAAQGVRVLGASNYYDYHVYQSFTEQAARRGIFPVFGLEIVLRSDELAGQGVLINDPGNPGKIYLCGKAITRFCDERSSSCKRSDDMTPTASELMGLIRRNDEHRMGLMVERLAEIFFKADVPTNLTAPRIMADIAKRYGCQPSHVVLQERHVAAAFQEALFALVPAKHRAEKLVQIFGAEPRCAPNDHAGLQGEIRAHLMKAGKPAFVEEQFIDFEGACRLILELGGMPCYPTLADGAKPICAYEQPVEKLIERIQTLGLHCTEFIPVRNAPDVLTEYVTAMRAAGLVVTAGTEHNTPDLLPIEPTCKGGLPIPEPVAAIFQEGMCIVVAHQFLTLHGACGYVDRNGDLCAGYDSHEQRIAAFRRMGEAILQLYFERCKTTE